MEIEVVQTDRGPRFLWVKKNPTWGEPTEYLVDILSAPMSGSGEQIRHYRTDGTRVKSGTIRWDGYRDDNMPKFMFGRGTSSLQAKSKQFQIGDKLTISTVPGRPEGRYFDLRLWLEMTFETAFTRSGVPGPYDFPPE